ncbi:YkgJ family cysteine cluster protein [Roseateles sp. DB2]|uniref:YkgJ family cysteine cluster protein n=1 Tax=Roseateles sp. DB2 TaxID=3453717 RepID=UPI003EEFEFAA
MPIEISKEEAEAANSRRAAFVASIPAALQETEDTLAVKLRNENSSRRTKLRRVYAVMDALAEVRASYVACRKGCSACCRMNVQISYLEAQRLAEASGRTPVPLHSSRAHSMEKFAGSPCPFLSQAGECSVYDARPFSCRNHASFLSTDEHCRLPIKEQGGMPLVRFDGLLDAMRALQEGKEIIGDIRDFFPPRQEAKSVATAVQGAMPTDFRRG